MNQVRITEISGGTFPINVYMSDIYGNNLAFLGTISGPTVPPVVEYNTTIPAIFESAPEILLTLIDDNGCQTFKVLQCTFGCTFQITIQLASCVVNITISPQS